MTSRRTVLLTGASGVVGRAVLRAADDRDRGADGGSGADLRMIAAVYRTGVPEAAETAPGFQVSAERFGLDRDRYEALVRDVDVVIHSAGETEWGKPAEHYRPVNIDGTRRVVEFAEQAGATVHFISTAFVAALGDDAPEPLSAGNICRNYIASKQAAEELLRDSGLPHTVFRPTNLVGEARTGWTSRGQIVQAMSDWLLRGRAPFLPVHPGIRMDFVPQDVLADAVLRAVELDDSRGAFWVTCGPAAMDVATCLDVLVKHAAGRGRTLTPPPLADIRELGPGVIDGCDPMTRMHLAVLRDVSEVTWCSGGVLPTSMPELRERYGVAEFDDAGAYAASLDYAADHRDGI